MKTCLTFIALLWCSVICNAQKFTLNQGGTTPGYYEELPYTEVNGKIFITVELNGVKRRFLFDTGATMIVSDALAAELKTPEIARDTVGDVNGAKTITSITKVDITLGKTIFKGIPALRSIPSGIMSCWDIDGVVGSNLLRNSIVQIDSKKHLLIITDQKNKLGLKNANSTKLISTKGEQSMPLVELTVKGKLNLIIEFDSGDNSFLRLTKDMTDQMEKANVYDTVARGYGANAYGMLGLQKDAEKYRINMPYLNIGQARFENIATETNKTGIPGIGTELLKYGIVTLDFIHQKFYFDADSAVIKMNAKFWPVSPAINNDQLLIGVVWDKFAGKVLPGEQVIAINDVDCSHVNFCELINKGPILGNAETAILTIKDKNGKLRKVEINKE